MIKQMKIKGGRKKESESTYECNYEPERERERARNCRAEKRGGGSGKRAAVQAYYRGRAEWNTLLCASNFSGPCKWPARRDSTLGVGGGGA